MPRCPRRSFPELQTIWPLRSRWRLIVRRDSILPLVRTLARGERTSDLMIHIGRISRDHGISIRTSTSAYPPWRRGRRELVGVYHSLEAAHSAVERLRTQPGFRDHPRIVDPEQDTDEQGFHIGAYPLDQDHWSEGYVTL